MTQAAYAKIHYVEKINDRIYQMELIYDPKQSQNRNPVRKSYNQGTSVMGLVYVQQAGQVAHELYHFGLKKHSISSRRSSQCL